MNKIKVVVVDDEYFNRGLITMLIGKLGDNFQVVGEAENLRDGYKTIQNLKPDVVFLDIKMPDGSGFELLRMFDQIFFEVVFVTGFDDFVLKAFEFNAVDYILKPIDLDKFKQTLDKLEYQIENYGKNDSTLHNFTYDFSRRSFPIKVIELSLKDNVEIVRVEDIIFAEQLSGGIVEFVTFQNNRFTSSKPITEFSFVFEQFRNFFGPQDGIVVNLKFVKELSHQKRPMLIMTNGERILVNPNLAEKLEMQLTQFRAE